MASGSWTDRRPQTKAPADLAIGGKTIAKGDKIAMGCVSRARDESAPPRADRLIIDRTRPGAHAAFGLRIHRCLRRRLAEMPLWVAWQEILARRSALA